MYVVSLSAEVDRTAGFPEAPLSSAAIQTLLKVRPKLTVDGGLPTATMLAERIGSFWLPDEGVLYVGLAGTSLRSRVSQYYKTPLGARRPHAGGWFLKTLANLDELFVRQANRSVPACVLDCRSKGRCSQIHRRRKRPGRHDAIRDDTKHLLVHGSSYRTRTRLLRRLGWRPLSLHRDGAGRRPRVHTCEWCCASSSRRGVRA